MCSYMWHILWNAKENVYAFSISLLKYSYIKIIFSTVFLFYKYHNITEDGWLNKNTQESFVLFFGPICYDFTEIKYFAAIDLQLLSMRIAS